MKTVAIVNGRVVTPHEVHEKTTLLIEGERIVRLQPGALAPESDIVIDANGYIVAPGFIDVHIHGGAGYDTMDATPQALRGMADFCAAHGVTSFLPTTIAAEQNALLAAIKNAAECQYNYQGGARILGVHLEGPYLSHLHPGAQPVRHIRKAELSEYRQLFAYRNILLISLAPEIPENLDLIAYALARGAAVAVGHSAASYEEVMEGVKRGLNQACHIFNGMGSLHHRVPGTVGAVLACDEIYAQMIVDFVHIHPAIVKMVIRAKGVERCILITDAILAAGLPEGVYKLGGGSVTVRGKAVYLTDGSSLAGSVLTIDQALRNVMEATGLSLVDALPMATSVPARSLGLGHEIGAIVPGYIADLAILDQDANVQATMVRGNIVYQTERFPLR